MRQSRPHLLRQSIPPPSTFSCGHRAPISLPIAPARNPIERPLSNLAPWSLPPTLPTTRATPPLPRRLLSHARDSSSSISPPLTRHQPTRRGRRPRKPGRPPPARQYRPRAAGHQGAGPAHTLSCGDRTPSRQPYARCPGFRQALHHVFAGPFAGDEHPTDLI